jgi:hypothetical protein
MITSTTDYRNYQIIRFEDGTFDIEKGGELVDGGFKSYVDCRLYIDELINP